MIPLTSHDGAADLSVFFEKCFLPNVLKGKNCQYVSSFRTAIRWLAKALGRQPTLRDLSIDAIDAMAKPILDSGAKQGHADVLSSRLRAIWRFAFQIGAVDKLQIRRRPRAPDKATGKPNPEPEAPAGSVRHFFETVYCPQKMLGTTDKAKDDHRRVLRGMRDIFKRDVMLSELSDSLAAQLFDALLARRISNTTVNNYRAKLFSVWRFAYDRGLLNTLPRVEKLKEHIDEPDAWTEDEARRILEAAERLEGSPLAGIPRNKFWKALLLVGYWTALRRGSLLAIERSDVDLENGWLYLPGNKIKNKRGKRFRLGPDALNAIREIWMPPRELLFPWTREISETKRDFRKILQLAGIAPSRRKSMTQMHKWRRTVATLAAMRGGLASAIALLGHSGADVTKRYIDPSKLPGNDATEFLPTLTNSSAALPPTVPKETQDGNEDPEHGDGECSDDSGPGNVGPSGRKPDAPRGDSKAGPDSKDTTSRRAFLKAGLGLFCAFALPKRSHAADPRLQAWLDANGAKLPGFLIAMCNRERQGIKYDESNNDNLRYLTLEQFKPNVILCVIAARSGEVASITAAENATMQSGCQLLAEGASDDRRVAAFFASGDVSAVAPMLSKLAPPEEHWIRHNRPSGCLFYDAGEA